MALILLPYITLGGLKVPGRLTTSSFCHLMAPRFTAEHRRRQSATAPKTAIIDSTYKKDIYDTQSTILATAAYNGY
jgi:hypothetical protein